MGPHSHKATNTDGFITGGQPNLDTLSAKYGSALGIKLRSAYIVIFDYVDIDHTNKMSLVLQNKCICGGFYDCMHQNSRSVVLMPSSRGGAYGSRHTGYYSAVVHVCSTSHTRLHRQSFLGCSVPFSDCSVPFSDCSDSHVRLLSALFLIALCLFPLAQQADQSALEFFRLLCAFSRLL